MSRTKRKIGICGRGVKLLGCFSAAFATASVALGQTPTPSSTPLAGAFDPPYVLTGAIALPGGDKITSFDISFVDPVTGRYYLANRTSFALIAVDTSTNKVVLNSKPGFAGFTGNNDTSGPDGDLTVDHKEIWVGDAPSRVWVLDINTGAPLAGFANPISTSPTPGGAASTTRADEMCYDPVDKIVMVANNADSPPYVTFISTTTKSVLGKVAFDGTKGTPKSSNGAEQCVWNPRNGKFYITIPEVGGPGDNSAPGAVVMLDPVTRAVLAVASIPVAACTGPQGLAVGPAPQLGLGCNVSPTAANNAIIADGTSAIPFGTVLASFPGNGGCDMTWYNPGNNKYFAACRQAPGGEALFIVDANTFAVQRLFTGTASNAHSVAVDPIRNTAYVPVSSASTSKLCSSMGAVDLNGCILVFTPAPPSPEPGCFTSTVLGDFNGDARADIGFRNNNGAITFWLLNGTNISVLGNGTVGPEWNIAGFADLNGDGQSDIVWRRSTDGSVAVWLMNGTTVLSAVGIGVVGLEWHIVGLRDFDGDGKADILWRRATDGSNAIWFMNGGTVTSVAPVALLALDWQVFGVGDFDGDKKGDILLRNLNGAVAIWFMNGATVASAVGVGTVGTDWTIAGVTDFNNDNKSDIVWRNVNGFVDIWLMSGAQVASAVGIGFVGTEWTLAGTGDIDGTGTGDLLWRNNTGAVAFWFMNGAQVVSVVGVGTVGTDWHSCQHEPIGPL
jgi:hypothetical protein